MDNYSQIPIRRLLAAARFCDRARRKELARLHAEMATKTTETAAQKFHQNPSAQIAQIEKHS